MELLLFETSWMDVWEGREPSEPVGAVFTKPEVTSLILDLAGYIPGNGRLAERRLLEPSCGDGAFLAAIIRRLIASERLRFSRVDWQDAALANALTACDLNGGFVAQARNQVAELLEAEGCPLVRAQELGEQWIRHADFLLTNWSEPFEFVVGNPPYVRIEDLPARVLQRYRELYPTCADRADLYVAFFENGLRLLSPTGCLAYICANRFAKNLYGRGLRRLIAQRFHVRYYLNLEHTQPFATEVSAYPCITVIDRQRGEPTRAATLEQVDETALAVFRPAAGKRPTSKLAVFPSWYENGEPWTATERTSFDLLALLAAKCPLLEESAVGTKVGIGVATGSDRVFVRNGMEETIERECQLPLLMAADIAREGVIWSGHYLINPYDAADDGRLRDFGAFPGLAAYFERHRATLMKRHVAQKRSESWYRTIDRVTLSLAKKPKLVIPDIQAGGLVGFDDGKYYPHHNVYWVTSEGWDLRVLQALLRSQMVLAQIRAFSVQLRGGSVRYQAQVLRKLRVPDAAAIPADIKRKLAAVAEHADQAVIDDLAAVAYGL
jgi:hypothetical protein